MFNCLKDSQYAERWVSCEINEFTLKFATVETIKAAFNRKEITVCLQSVAGKLKALKVAFGLSWPKYRIADLLFTIANEEHVDYQQQCLGKKQSVKSLKFLSRKVVSSLSKTVLNAVYAEYILPTRLRDWRNLNFY